MPVDTTNLWTPTWQKADWDSTGSSAWAYWTDSDSNVTTNTSSVTGGDVWVDWTSQNTTAQIYSRWIQYAADTIAHADPYAREFVERNQAALRGPTPEQQAAARAEARRKDRLSQEAKTRAEELLVAHLTPEQAREFQANRRFHVVGADGNRYRVDCRMQHQNIRRLDAKGQEVEEFCIYAGGVPLADNHLAQKLMLETNLDEFRRLANRFDLRRAGG